MHLAAWLACGKPFDPEWVVYDYQKRVEERQIEASLRSKTSAVKVLKRGAFILALAVAFPLLGSIGCVGYLFFSAMYFLGIGGIAYGIGQDDGRSLVVGICCLTISGVVALIWIWGHS
ncbi:MAG: hypothetical protein COA56_17535 [Dehalococcoidia bacterium]|jgi:hypothetical protein|nr:MAG: hypothetical protein COA56_17535 [Dehalococcoidia bacterium]